MKSKAQEYFDEINKSKPNRPLFKSRINDEALVCHVASNRSKVTCVLQACEITVEDALSLRNWLTDTFDVPKLDPISYSRKDMTDKDWIKDIKPGFVGITKIGQKAMYISDNNNYHVWALGELATEYAYCGLINCWSLSGSDNDIVGPWEETK